MMEHKKALTISLTVDKDNSTIHWTKIAGSKARYHDSQHKNGSVQFDHSQATMAQLGIASRKPYLILTDVLKTELGRAYLDRNNQSQTLGNGGRVTSPWKESRQWIEESPICEDRRSGQRVARREGSAHKNKRTLSLSSRRLSLRRRSQEADDEDEEEEDKEVRAEVVDCGLSVTWEPSGDARGNEFSPASTDDRWTHPGHEEQHCAKRKNETPEPLHCNGTGTSKGHRGSVLRLSGEGGRDEGGPASKRLCMKGSGGDGESESLGCGIVQFTVGGDEAAEGGLSPIVSPGSGAGETRHSLSSIQDNITKASPSEPIVLSSDDEEAGGVPERCSPVFHPLVVVGETATQGQHSQEAVAKQQEVYDMQVVHVVVEDFPGAVASDFGVSPIPGDYSCVGVSFSALHCGGYWGEANGQLMIADQRVIIPLKDASGQVQVTLTLEPTGLRRYSVWEHQELQALGLCYKGKEQPPPAALLLLYVSDTQTTAAQRDLHKLSVKQHGTTPTGQASPFLLLSLRDPLEGVEGAVLRSILDIVCLHSPAHERSCVASGIDSISGLENIHTPVLSLDDSLELIKITGLDPQLLSLLGQDSLDPVPNTEQDLPHSDGEKETEPHIHLEVESQTESLPKLQKVPEQDTRCQPKPEEEQKEKEEPPTEESREEPTPIYTLCHRRTRGSYSVSLSKPDSNWTKFKHQGLTRRLIQFPPPPLKGGITVMMEDLQCLDSGQYLNDVIIDFYLKYLLQNAPAALAERSHIFSSFFYKQLTRRDNASEGSTTDSCQRQRRHQRVKTWTRHVDIFKKDFLFVPVNQEAHWYLVVICFPGLEEPQFESWTGPGLQKGTGQGRAGEPQGQEEVQGLKSANDVTKAPPDSDNPSDNLDSLTENAQADSTKEPPPGPPNCTEQSCQKETVCKRPCILIMDSLKVSLHERVFKLLREYLQSEWEVRRGSVRDFSAEQMKSSHCRVPLQDNSSDCGLYLLQYVESFLKDPVVHFDLPLRLERWFPRQQVRRKRDEIRDLVLNLYRHQNLEKVGI